MSLFLYSWILRRVSRSLVTKNSPVRTQRCLNVYTTYITLGRRCMDVKTTLSAYWDFLALKKRENQKSKSKIFGRQKWCLFTFFGLLLFRFGFLFAIGFLLFAITSFCSYKTLLTFTLVRSRYIVTRLWLLVAWLACAFVDIYP